MRNQTECSKDCFKSMLDRFLQKIPDHSLLRSNTYSRRALSNSLIDMIKLTHLHYTDTHHATNARLNRPDERNALRLAVTRWEFWNKVKK